MESGAGGGAPTGVPPGPIGPGSGRGGGGSRFRTVLYVLVAVGAVLVVTCAGVLFFVAQDPTVRETVEAVMASQHAPGTEELRAAGCVQAGVADVSAAMSRALESAEAEDRPGLPTLFVTCHLGPDASLDCEQVARIYVDAVGQAPRRFVAQVNTGGLTPEIPCQLVFDRDGNRLGTLEEVAQQR